MPTALATPTFNITTVAYNGFSLANIQSENASSFLMRWSLSGQNSWTEVSVEGSTYTATGLTAATAYDVQVKAVGDGVDYEDSGWSESSTVSTLTRLTTPTITAVLIDRTKIQVNGLSVPNANGYQVRIGTLSGGMPAYTVTPVEGVYEFNALCPRSMYYIQARALGDDETYDASDWCAEISILTGQVIDVEMEIPEIEVATENYTTLRISGLTQYSEYRFQIATTEAGVASAPIRNTGCYGGYTYVRGLEPGTTYYVRVCLIEGEKCSLWSDIVSGTTAAVTNTITVTSGADSGTGTLRQAITNASTNGTKIVLDVDSITLNSVVSHGSKRVFIVGGKTARTIIKPGNSNALLNITYASGRHLEFTGNIGDKIGVQGGHYDDCVINGLITTGVYGLTQDTGFSNSVIKDSTCGCSGLYRGTHIDCVISNVKATDARSTLSGAGSSSAQLYNCLIKDCVAAGTVTYNSGGGCRSAGLTNCTVMNCSATSGGGIYYSTAIHCTIQNNYCSNSGGGAYQCTCRYCVITDNKSGAGGGANTGTYEHCVITNNYASNTGGGASTGTYEHCVITNNLAGGNGGGVYQGSLSHCTISNNRGNHGGGIHTSTDVTDCVISDNTAAQNGGGTVSANLTNCIVTRNRALGPTPNTGNSGCGGGVNGGTATDCEITHNYTVQAGGGAYGGTLTNCTITDNESGGNGGGVSGDGNRTNCLIKNNVAAGYGGGAYSGSLLRCVVTENQSGMPGGGSCSSNLYSTIVYNNKKGFDTDDYSHYVNYERYIRNATIGVIRGVYSQPKFYMYNTLYKSTDKLPTGANLNNVAYGANGSDYFVDEANYDYRLKPGSLAIEQGNNDNLREDMTTDLAGNTRILGTNVDLGCYEFVPVQLPTPTLNLETGYNTATIYFTLPGYCSSYEIEYAHNADFTNSGTATASTTGFVLPGLSGDTYLRARYKGVSGHTLDSEWSEVVYHYFDTTAPTVVQSTETLIMTVNTTVDFTSGMTVSDDHDPNVIPYYEVLDSNDDPIEVNGETHNIPSSSLAVGIYTLRFTATDAANNTGISTRPLEVRPPVLPTPTISFYTSSTDSITVAGLTEQFAEGWTVNVNGTSSTAEPDANGRLVIDGLRVTNVYEIKVMALGNGITTGDSAWSNVVTASPSPAIIAYSDIHIANEPTGQYSAVRKADLNERVPTGGQKGEVIVWGDDGPEWTPGIIPIVRVIR